jgi:hypothetical protein
MSPSITKTRKSRRGRPFVGAIPVQVRMPPAELASLDDWIARQDNTPSRPEAMRRLVERALRRSALQRAPNKKTARKASTLAAREIENLGDSSQPLEEQQRRKRRLIRGPSEFRDIRADQPKTKG